MNTHYYKAKLGINAIVHINFLEIIGRIVHSDSLRANDNQQVKFVFN